MVSRRSSAFTGDGDAALSTVGNMSNDGDGIGGDGGEKWKHGRGKGEEIKAINRRRED